MQKSTLLLKSLITGVFISLACFGAMAQNCTANFTFPTSIDSCTVPFTNTSQWPATPIPQWSWNFGDGQTSTQMHPTHTYTASGSYSVCLTMTSSDSTCVQTICQNVQFSCTNGIEDVFQSGNSLSVLSNPVQSSTLIYYNLQNASQVEIAVFDLLGNKVTVLESSGKNPGVHSLNWNVGTLESGIYFLQLNTEGTAVTRKVVVAK